MSAAASALEILAERGQSLAVAESLTGGLLAAEFVAVPGASRVFSGGVVSYNTEIKASLLGVDAELLAQHGAVHERVAAEMATGVCSALAIDGVAASYGISTTGVAGPDAQDGQAVGTVFIGLAGPSGVEVHGLRLSGDRAAIRSQTVEAAVRMLLDRLKDLANVLAAE